MHTIYHDLLIKAPLNKVFEAVSKPKHLNNWWTLKCSGKPELGEKYNLYFAPEYNWYAELVVCEKDKSLHLKMTEAMPDWMPTTFGFDLEENTQGTLVHFFHKDWLQVSNEYRISSFCWAMLLNGLKNYVEKGIVIPFEQRN